MYGDITIFLKFPKSLKQIDKVLWNSWRECVCEFVCLCVCKLVFWGRKKCDNFLSGKSNSTDVCEPRFLLSCLVFVCCTQQPPGCLSRGYWSLSTRWQISLTQEEVCVLCQCVTNHTHTHNHHLFRWFISYCLARGPGVFHMNK